jgi:hypothetical protein
VVYATSALLFLSASLLIWRIRIERIVPKREPATLKSIFAGIAFIRSKPAVLGAISLDLFAVLLGGATALLPIYARDILQTGPWGLGVLRSAPAVGALTMALILAIRAWVGRTMFAAVTAFGIATSLPCRRRSSCLGHAGRARRERHVQRRHPLVTGAVGHPDAMRGRVSAVNSVFIARQSTREFESGVTAAWLGTVPAVLLGGVGTVLVVLLWMRLFPALLHRDRLLDER